jgi:UrcA family protein
MKTRTVATSISFLIASAIVGTSVLTYAASSRAADRDEVRQIVVRFDDLNISSPRGAAALYRRIAAAASEVCSAFDLGARELGSRASVDDCVQNAISGAVTKVDRSELFAIYNAKNSKPLGSPVADVQIR